MYVHSMVQGSDACCGPLFTNNGRDRLDCSPELSQFMYRRFWALLLATRECNLYLCLMSNACWLERAVQTTSIDAQRRCPPQPTTNNVVVLQPHVIKSKSLSELNGFWGTASVNTDPMCLFSHQTTTWLSDHRVHTNARPSFKSLCFP